MSSARDINLDLNPIVETSDDSDAVNGHRYTWSLGNDLDLQPVDTWVNRSPATNNDVYTTVDTVSAPIFTTPYQATTASTSIQAAVPLAHTHIIPCDPTTSPSTEMSSPEYMQASAGTSPTTSTPFESSTALTQPLYFSVSSSEGVIHYHCCCGYETIRKTDLRRHHESSKHSGQKYFCLSCGKGYTRKYNLEQHEKKNHL